MTDIEKLRDDVIKAARAAVENDSTENLMAQQDAILALDAAMRPDPWALLQEYVDDTVGQDGHTWEEFCNEWEPRVVAALAWRQENPDA